MPTTHGQQSSRAVRRGKAPQTVPIDGDTITGFTMVFQQVGGGHRPDRPG